ncbi:uncharacterized protein LOC130757384 [Actinidia eriantha]|uniref:uncharacterized protein LOC130757384 n=1 Tax=Actinidia eriantha TaxID=165200 RepID=UPI0025825DD2|nr:uncharacterized protein LOC130757384 [Actinidia eriantha]
MEKKNKVMENGPYLLYGSPLLLKPMSKYFGFGKEELSSFPIWVQLRNVPYTLWNHVIFGKIYSKIGRPIHMDKMTTKKERVTYARCLVEVDMAKELTHSVMLHLPEGEEHEQRIYYESLPRYCPQCNVLGHTKESCKGKLATVSKAGTKPTETPAVATTSKAESGKKGHQEWTVVQRNGSKINPGVKVASTDPEPIEIIPEIQENVASIAPAHLLSPALQSALGTQRLGLNKPLKQNGILNHLRKSRAAIMGILETKLSSSILERLIRSNLRGWQTADNFSQHPNGHILIIWKEDLVHLDFAEATDQVIHCLATCKSSNFSFSTSFVHGFNTAVGRRTLWDNLHKFSSSLHAPWIILGDFNNVLNMDERVNGRLVTMYETRDFKDCCYNLGLSDIRFSGLYHTWSNNTIWCKLDQAVVNYTWTQQGLSAHAHFDPLGKLSDHSPYTISILGENDRGATPFKFFNIWENHESFVDLVSSSWNMQIEGNAMYILCKKLKALKDPLKSLNKLHFSHISTRTMAAEEELQQAQL